MFRSWFSCCGSDEKPHRSESSPRLGSERNIVVLRDQPAIIPPPSAEPLWSSEKTYEKMLEQERQRERTRLRKTVSRDSSSSRRTWFAKSPSSQRRLLISGPTDFRHLHSESFQFPPPAPEPVPRQRRRSFRPIELSIYQPHNRLSAILPHLQGCEESITPPPRVYTANSSRWDGSSTTVSNDRSNSVMSFHYPRRHGRQNSSISDASMSPPRPPRSDASMSPPRIPAKSRARASTAPNTTRIVERIASALIEKERLQSEINSLVERQSIFFNSRPSTSYTMRGYEPMPSIPALPAAAPSFAERLSVDGRPQTAPSHMSSAMLQQKTLELAAMAAQTPYNTTGPTQLNSPTSDSKTTDDLDRPLAPPLPLVLRPPLRKKKSFSRVSSWLFHPEAQHQQQQQQYSQNKHHWVTSTASTSPTAVTSNITTSPQPIKASDGFYQCVAPPEGLPRTSMETSSSVYTWETRGDDDDSNDESNEDDDDEAKTVPTTAPAWSPDQTPKQGGVGSKEGTPVLGADAKMGRVRQSSPARMIRQSSPVLGGGVGDESGVVVESGMGVGNVEGLGVVNPATGHRPLSVGVAF